MDLLKRARPAARKRAIESLDLHAVETATDEISVRGVVSDVDRNLPIEVAATIVARKWDRHGAVKGVGRNLPIEVAVKDVVRNSDRLVTRDAVPSLDRRRAAGKAVTKVFDRVLARTVAVIAAKDVDPSFPIEAVASDAVRNFPIEVVVNVAAPKWDRHGVVSDMVPSLPIEVAATIVVRKWDLLRGAVNGVGRNGPIEVVATTVGQSSVRRVVGKAVVGIFDGSSARAAMRDVLASLARRDVAKRMARSLGKVVISSVDLKRARLVASGVDLKRARLVANGVGRELILT